MIIDDLIKDLKVRFDSITDTRSSINTKYSLGNLLMSGFALFSLKDSSLLQYIAQYPERSSNLRTVYGITQCPSDSCMRQVLDQLPPENLKGIPGEYLKILDTENYLASYELSINGFGKRLYIPMDGTTYFSSSKVHCEHCQSRQHRNGTVTYSHGALTAVIAHPEKSIVLPVAMEDIQVQDGACKNDHELCAAQRLLPMIAKSVGSHRGLIGGDALFANAPLIRLVHSFKFNFLLSIKEGNQPSPFAQFKDLKNQGNVTKIVKVGHGFSYVYEYANHLFLNNENNDLKINFLKLTVTQLATQEVTTFCWITDIPINIMNYKLLGKIGRTRWKIENETFNALKNQGYHFEHNFGHGTKSLAQNFAQLLFLAFGFDQINHWLDDLAKRALTRCGSFKKLCADIRKYFDIVPVQNFEHLFKIITRDIKLSVQMQI
jgi:hypothetical protein